jgi:uncharacterized protein YuzE
LGETAKEMKVVYFRETDTAELRFCPEAEIDRTQELGNDVYVYFDKDNDVIGMLIEHASQRAGLPAVTVEEIGE